RDDEGAALDVVERHFADRAMQQRLNLAPGPEERRVRRLRLDRGNALVAIPQRMQVFGFELGDEGRSFGRSGCNVSHDRSCAGLTRASIFFAITFSEDGLPGHKRVYARLQRATPGNDHLQYLTSSAASRRRFRCR